MKLRLDFSRYAWKWIATLARSFVSTRALSDYVIYFSDILSAFILSHTPSTASLIVVVHFWKISCLFLVLPPRVLCAEIIYDRDFYKQSQVRGELM